MTMSHHPNCFGCSLDNLLGLKVNFTIRGDCVIGEFNSNNNHIGPPDTVHGGVIASLLDEAMAYAAIHLLRQDSRTVREEIVFRNSAKTGDKIYVEASVKEEKSRTAIITAKVYSQTTTIAEGAGTLFRVKGAV